MNDDDPPVDPNAAANLDEIDREAAGEGRKMMRAFRSCVKPSSRQFHTTNEGVTERKHETK